MRAALPVTRILVAIAIIASCISCSRSEGAPQKAGDVVIINAPDPVWDTFVQAVKKAKANRELLLVLRTYSLTTGRDDFGPGPDPRVCDEGSVTGSVTWAPFNQRVVFHDGKYTRNGQVGDCVMRLSIVDPSSAFGALKAEAI